MNRTYCLQCGHQTKPELLVGAMRCSTCCSDSLFYGKEKDFLNKLLRTSLTDWYQRTTVEMMVLRENWDMN